MIVLTAAGLFTASLRRLKGIDLGMNVEQVLTFTVTPELNGYSPERTAAFVADVRRELAALPGASAAGAAELGVLTDSDASSNATIEGYTAGPDEDIRFLKNMITPGYFAAVGIPLLAGRDFTEADAASAPKVAIVNQTLARKYFAGRDPIGAKFVFGAGKVTPDTTIIGVVPDSKHTNVRDEVRTFVYTPCAQDDTLGGVTFYVRSALPPASLSASVRALVARRDAGLPVHGIKTLVEQRDESIYSERLLSSLSITFGALAALLAAIGLYGTMAYSVIRRTREIGVRVALGAAPRDIRSLVLREAGVLSVIGLGLGLPLAWAGGRLARSLLYGIEPGDPRLLAAAGLALVLVMTAAALLPARRAARVDPLTALRSE